MKNRWKLPSMVVMLAFFGLLWSCATFKVPVCGSPTDCNCVVVEPGGDQGRVRVCQPPSPSPNVSPTPAPSASPIMPSPTPEPSAPPTPAPSPSTPPTPTPQATPATCPPLNRVGTHAPATGMWWDSTPRFGTAGNGGQPCNSDHHAVCSATGDDHGNDWRHCEDPGGNEWSARNGARIMAVENPGSQYGFTAKISGPGQIRVCPAPNAKDEEGVLLRFVGANNGCSDWIDVPYTQRSSPKTAGPRKTEP